MTNCGQEDDSPIAVQSSQSECQSDRTNQKQVGERFQECEGQPAEATTRCRPSREGPERLSKCQPKAKFSRTKSGSEMGDDERLSPGPQWTRSEKKYMNSIPASTESAVLQLHLHPTSWRRATCRGDGGLAHFRRKMAGPLLSLRAPPPARPHYGLRTCRHQREEDSTRAA